METWSWNGLRLNNCKYFSIDFKFAIRAKQASFKLWYNSSEQVERSRLVL